MLTRISSAPPLALAARLGAALTSPTHPVIALSGEVSWAGVNDVVATLVEDGVLTARHSLTGTETDAKLDELFAAPRGTAYVCFELGRVHLPRRLQLASRLAGAIAAGAHVVCIEGSAPGSRVLAELRTALAGLGDLRARPAVAEMSAVLALHLRISLQGVGPEGLDSLQLAGEVMQQTLAPYGFVSAAICEGEGQNILQRTSWGTIRPAR